MTQMRTNPALPRSARLLGRSLLIMATWVTAVAIAGAGYSSINERQRPDDIVDFACSFAIASVVASVVALALSGRYRRAIEWAAAMSGFVAIVAGLAYVLLWPAHSLGLRVFSVRQILMLREGLLELVAEIGRLNNDVGAVLLLSVAIGVVVGVIAGVLGRVGDRRPRLAIGLAAILLLFCGSGAAQHLIFGVGSEWLLRWRHQQRVNWAIADISRRELTAALGATGGGLVGALAAGLSLYRARRSPAASATLRHAQLAQGDPRQIPVMEPR